MKNTFIYNEHTEFKKVLSTLEQRLANCDEFIFSVAFISHGGLTALLQTLKNLEERNVRGKILTTNYQWFNKPQVLDKIANFKNIELKIFDCEKHLLGFHTKGYMFRTGENWQCLLGSSNLTASALTVNKEWNILIEDDATFSQEILKQFLLLWQLADNYKNIRDSYRKSYNDNIKINGDISSQRVEKLVPNDMQRRFIKNFTALRENNNKALLISATGTGKTYACAFAMEKIKAKKIVFIVHREQIARKAMETFKNVFGSSRTMGLFTGNKKELDVDFLFATVQTLSKDTVLTSFPKNYFDEIIIDEVHRAGASSYLKIMNHFQPKFYLGMTASPDRTDGFNIYELFDNNIVYEIRLQEALSQNMLSPFHYFGISDLEINGENVDDFSDFNKLISDDRVSHIIEKINYYGYSGSRVKGLIFCSSTKEAKELSIKFNERGFRTTWLTGSHSMDERERAISRLTGEDDNYLDYIFTVDIFNEGVDIPEINQVVMLRATESAIVFIQQLGRGLRKNKDKDFVVILDFIANYKNNFLIPIALSGDNSYDKDNIRKFLSQGTRYLPGVSTIHFDEIAKSRIYEAIDAVKLNTWQLLVDGYTKLKNKLGRIPKYKDFDNGDWFNSEKIFEIAGSYHNFLVKKEKEYKITLNSIQENMLQFISQNLILSKKIEELIILKLLLERSGDIEQIFLKTMQNEYGKTLKDYEVELSKKILTNNFVTSSITKRKFEASIFVNYEKEGIIISDVFREQLRDVKFKKMITNLLVYAIDRYDKLYKNSLYEDSNFVLYEKYNFETICKLFAWPTNYVPLAIGGYKYDERTRTLPVFINYDIDENSFNHDYTHGFLPDDMFTSMSKPRRNLSSKENNYFYDDKTKIYLFMRKNKNDKNGASEFYFLGRMETVGDAKLVEREKSGDSVLQFFFKMKNKVREDLYEYFTKEKV